MLLFICVDSESDIVNDSMLWCYRSVVSVYHISIPRAQMTSRRVYTPIMNCLSCGIEMTVVLK